MKSISYEKLVFLFLVNKIELQKQFQQSENDGAKKKNTVLFRFTQTTFKMYSENT